MLLLCFAGCNNNSHEGVLLTKIPDVPPSLEWKTIPEKTNFMTFNVNALIDETEKKKATQFSNKSEFETTAAYKARISAKLIEDKTYWVWISGQPLDPEYETGSVGHARHCDTSVKVRYDADRTQFDVSLQPVFIDGKYSINVKCGIFFSNEEGDPVKEIGRAQTLIELDNLMLSDYEKVHVSIPMSIQHAKESNRRFPILLIAKPDQDKGSDITRSKMVANYIGNRFIAMKAQEIWIFNEDTREVLKKIRFKEGL